MKFKSFSVIASSLAALLISSQAFAVDTTEVVDKGKLSLEPTFSVSNISKNKPAFSVDMANNYGVTDSLTLGFGVALAGAEFFATPSAALSINALASLYDSDNFDVDGWLDFSLDGGEFGATLGFEFNYDFEPDLAAWGLFLQLELPVGTHYHIDGQATPEFHAELGLGFNVGGYFTVAEGHQLLLAVGLGLNELTEKPVFAFGPVALGYNVMLSEDVELRSELAFNIPLSKDEKFSMGLSVGGIFNF